MKLASQAIHPRGRLNAANSALAAVIIGFGAYARFGHIPESFVGYYSGLLTNMFSGIRLHLLPWWNLSDPLRKNFFKSLLYTYHGLGDMFYYPVVQLYSLLHVPLSPWNLFAAKALLSTATLLVVFLLATSLFNEWIGLICTAFVALSPSHIAFSTDLDRITFVVFLQVLSVLAYYWYLKKGSWLVGVPTALLLGILAGCENFYYIFILLLLHFCYVSEPGGTRKDNVTCFWRSLWSVRTLAVWSPYFLMWGVNVVAYSQAGYHNDLTLLGHGLSNVLWKSSVLSQSVSSSMSEFMANEKYRIFDNAFNVLRIKSDTLPIFGLVYVASLAVNLKAALRLNTMKSFIWWWSVVIATLVFFTSIKDWYSARYLHLLVPTSLLIASTAADGLRGLAGRFSRGERAWNAWGAGLLGLGLLIALGPGALTAKQQAAQSHDWGNRKFGGDVFRDMKAVGAALRGLGHPRMNVFVLTTDSMIIAPMEYYFGLSYSNSYYEPNQLFFHADQYASRDGILMPEAIIEAYGLKDFDFYVDFVREPAYPEKEKVVANLKARGARLVVSIYHEPGDQAPEVQIYSPRDIPFRRYQARELEGTFDRQYANIKNLFYNVNVFTYYYYGYQWNTKPAGGRKGDVLSRS